MAMRERACAAMDTVLDRTVLLGYARPGYRLRERSWHSDDPAPGSLSGRTALVTGANSGVGKAIAAGYAKLGARVLMVVRTPERGEEAAATIRRDLPEADLRVLRCDVSDLDSVHHFAAELATQADAVDVIVHNAGLLPEKRTESPQGHELTLATHVLGPLLMTDLLRPRLAAADEGRVILMSSGGMYTAELPADDPEYREGTYKGARAYARTKRMQVAFTPLLAARLADDAATVASMHPGWVDTPGVTTSLPGFNRIMGPLLRDADEGADTAVWLGATEPAPPSGLFWHDRRSRPTHVPPWRSDDPAALQQLWSWCCEAVGIAP